MKLKNKIILYIIISALVITFLTTIVVATVSDVSKLKGTKNSKIGNVFTLSYSQMAASKDIYCIQKGKTLKGEVKFVLKNYVDIYGNEAEVYSSSSNKDPKVVKSSLNAQIAYILNRKQGYGSHDNPTDTQRALWHLINKWTTKIFENSTYSWEGNTTASKNKLNEDAEKYAEKIKEQGGKNETEISELKIVDKTNKDNISETDVDGYFRIGPFTWQFDGELKSISVKGDNGTINNSDIRFIKYKGEDANIVEVSKILTGEEFYVDIKQSTGISQITGMTLKTSSAAKEMEKIYTAKIWFFHANSYQNLIYVDVGDADTKPLEGEGKQEYDISLKTNIDLVKVDDRDTNIPLKGVGFKFKATVYRYIVVGSHTEMVDKDNDGKKETEITVDDYDWRWVKRYLGSDLSWSAESEDSAKIFYTDGNGTISESGISAETVQNGIIKAIEVSNPYYGYDIGKEFDIKEGYKNTKLENHQERVKLSGYVWIDENAGKTDERNDKYDKGESGFNDITVYLRDKAGNEIMKTSTKELGLYSEIEGGEYQFIDVDLDKLQAGEYYVEFEYCGITYQSVGRTFDNNGSKAIDTATRNILDNKFSSVDATGTQSLQMNGVTVNYNSVSDHVSTVNSHTGCNVYARTNEIDENNKVAYELYSGFTPTSEEIRYVNLGLFVKAQADYALAQDLYNVKVDVNGKSHVYKYAKRRYSNNGNDINEESSWNMGVKFQNDQGTYNRAIYKADAEYETPNHKDNEIKVYVTYKIALKNESTKYLGRINSIVDYCDNRYEIVKAGNSIDDKTAEIGDVLNNSSKTEYDNNYSKYIIDVNSTINPNETKYLYVQFKMDRAAVLIALNQQKLLNNVAEINSYTTFKDNNVNKAVAVIDIDSLVGNTKPGQIDTYEDDTDAARSLRLELKNERAIVGTVFVDSTGKDSNNVYANQERLGNGVFDTGETTIAGIKVTLHEIGKDDSSYDGERKTYYGETDQNGNFEIVGYVPGNYVLTYTWGNATYKVQYYKGTIYQENRVNKVNQTTDAFWYRGSESGNDTVSKNTRYTDAFDSSDIRKKIDDEMENLKYNTLENEINKAYNGGSEYIKQITMDSSTPTMSFSVEYETTVTDGTMDQVKFTIENVDFGIVERPKQKLELSKRVSGFKITLANGQILVDAEITEDGNLKGSHDHTTYMGPTYVGETKTSLGFVRAEMDNEIIEGATLEITYTMKVKNVGEKDYVSDRYYYYGNNTDSDVVRVSVTGLLDYVDGRLSVVDDKWEEKNQEFINQVNASQKDNEMYINSTRTYLTSHLSKELTPGESNEVTLHTSKLLTSTDDNTFDNQSEIVEVTKKDAFNTGTPVKVEWNEDKFNFNVANAETAIIIPSTGEDKSYATPIIIGMTSLLVLGVGVFVIKKFVIDNK